LADEVGLGKTIEAGLLLAQKRHLLVILPADLRKQWSQELELIRGMAERTPERVAWRDQGFAWNDKLNANAVPIFKTKDITRFRTV